MGSSLRLRRRSLGEEDTPYTFFDLVHCVDSVDSGSLLRAFEGGAEVARSLVMIGLWAHRVEARSPRPSS